MSFQRLDQEPNNEASAAPRAICRAVKKSRGVYAAVNRCSKKQRMPLQPRLWLSEAPTGAESSDIISIKTWTEDLFICPWDVCQAAKDGKHLFLGAVRNLRKHFFYCIQNLSEQHWRMYIGLRSGLRRTLQGRPVVGISLKKTAKSALLKMDRPHFNSMRSFCSGHRVKFFRHQDNNKQYRSGFAT